MSDPSPGAPSLSRYCRRYGFWLLLLLIAAAYANSLSVPFIFDDEFAIVRNQSIRDLSAWPEVLFADANTAGAAGRPVVNLTFALNYALHGLDPRGYHVINVLVHAAVTLVLWRLLRRSLRAIPGPVPPEHQEAVALGLSALWCAHPLLTVSVTVVQQRTELLVGLFILLTLYCLLRSAQSSVHRARWRVLSVATCALAMGSKEVAVGLPLLALLFDRAFINGGFARAWREGRFYYLALASSWLVLWWAMHSSGQRNNTAGLGLGVSPWHYLLTQCEALVLYAKLCVWPSPLIYDYGTALVQDWTSVWWQGLLVLAALGASIYALARHPRIGFCSALVFVVLAPSSSFVPVVTQTMGEQRMYLPSVAVLVLLVLAAYRLVGRAAIIVVALAAVAGAGASHLRNRDYASEESIWRDVTEKLPGGPRGYANLLYEWIQQGRDQEATLALPGFVRRLGEHHRSSQPFDEVAQTSQLLALMGAAYVDVRKIDVALDLYRRAAQLFPANDLAQFNCAKLLFDLKRHSEALPYLDAFLALKPKDSEALHMLGRCLMLTEQPERAELVLMRLLSISPSNLEARLDHADSVILQEKYAEGTALYQQLQRIAPRNPRVIERLAQLNHLNEQLR